MIKLGRKYARCKDNRRVVVPFPKVITDEIRASGPKDVTVVAYHTDDVFYTNEARRMTASAKRLGINVKTTVIPSKGGWEANTSFKSAYLQRERDLLSGAMLYVDVDTVFHRFPLTYLSQLDCDIAVYYDLGDGHLVSATLYLNDTAVVRKLLAEWNQQCKAHPEIWDQQVLQSIIEADQASGQSCYKVHHLPVGFCWIFDREDNLRAPQQDVFIEQLQSGRMLSEKLLSKENGWAIRKSKVKQRIVRIKEIRNVLSNQN